MLFLKQIAMHLLLNLTIWIILNHKFLLQLSIIFNFTLTIYFLVLSLYGQFYFYAFNT